MSAPILRVLRPGFLTTIQDLGRSGFQSLGVSPCGAMDTFALRLANRLVGNPAGFSCLEITLVGTELEMLADCEIAVTGGDLGARLDGEPLACWENCLAKAGQRLQFSERRRGARAYLGLRGGFLANEILGSGSTDLKNAWGGRDGQSLRKGDHLLPAANVLPLHWTRRALRPGTLAEYQRPFLLRALPGPQVGCFSTDQRSQFFSSEFRVGANSNRMGYRLEGLRLNASPAEIISDAIPFGAVQVLPDGQAVLLMADRHTVGGYPKIAVVISADLPKAAQLCASHRIRFKEVALEEAHRELATQEERIALGVIER